MTIEERAEEYVQSQVEKNDGNTVYQQALMRQAYIDGAEDQNIDGVGMNLYVSKYKGGFGGGLIVVAAFSQEDALEVAAKEARHDYYFKNWSHERNEWYTKLDSSMSPFEKIEGGRYYGDPCVVVESIYSE